MSPSDESMQLRSHYLFTIASHDEDRFPDFYSCCYKFEFLLLFFIQ